jgi:hypothetical protein
MGRGNGTFVGLFELGLGGEVGHGCGCVVFVCGRGRCSELELSRG